MLGKGQGSHFSQDSQAKIPVCPSSASWSWNPRALGLGSFQAWWLTRTTSGLYKCRFLAPALEMLTPDPRWGWEPVFVTSSTGLGVPAPGLGTTDYLRCMEMWTSPCGGCANSQGKGRKNWPPHCASHCTLRAFGVGSLHWGFFSKSHVASSCS